MDKWNEIKTAYQVAKLGTVSAAAIELGVHRATVLRHIDALEAELGTKLFQRNANGYKATDAGLDLMLVAERAEDEFKQLMSRSQSHLDELKGEFIFTSVEFIAPFLLPVVQAFQREHPKVKVRYLTSEKIFKLEHGEAHLALRSGEKPEELDNVVQAFCTLELGLFAHADYIKKKGLPTSVAEIVEHDFVTWDESNSGAPFYQWFAEHVPKENITLASNSIELLSKAILAGMGIGFYSYQLAKLQPELIEVPMIKERWTVPLWLVTHGDLHRSKKVQAFLKIMKQYKSIFEFKK